MRNTMETKPEATKDTPKAGTQKGVVMPAFSLMIAGVGALIIVVTLIEGWRLTQGELLVYYWERWLSALILIAASVALNTGAMFFKQRSAKLANGQKVREGDTVEFTNSDGEICRDVIRRDVNNPKRLFFWNNRFEIGDYKSVRRIDA